MILIHIYRITTTIITPLIRLLLLKRLLKGKESKQRIKERYGVSANKFSSKKKIIWLHGASVGEINVVLNLINEIKRNYNNKYNILITSGTIMSEEIVNKYIRNNKEDIDIIHQYIPVDVPKYVKRFFNYWRPDLGVLIESEIWINLLFYANKFQIPLFLINAKISDKSYRRWLKFPLLIKAIVSYFRFIIVQNEKYKKHFINLGANKNKIYKLDNIKYSSEKLKVNEYEFNKLKAATVNREVWVAASTHKGEELICAEIHNSLQKELLSYNNNINEIKSQTSDTYTYKFKYFKKDDNYNIEPDSYNKLLTIIVPRHPERGVHIAEELQRMGLKISLRSRNENITQETDIYIADTIGELGIFYQLSKIVFIGKSLIENGGGQNPIEALHFNCAVMYGSHMDNFTDISKNLLERGASVEIKNKEHFKKELYHLITDQEYRQSISNKGKEIIEKNKNLLKITLKIIKIKLQNK